MEWIGRLSIAALALSAALPRAHSDEPVAPRTGIFVLDNCDENFRGQETYGDNLTFLSPSGKQIFRQTGFNNCESIGSAHMVAIDSERQSVWVVENVGHRLQRFDFAGHSTLSVADVKADAVAIDPTTGNAWVLEGPGQIGKGNVAVFDDHGRRVAKYDVPGFDIVYDPVSQAFWIAGQKLVKLDASTGKTLFSEGVADWSASSVDVDHTSGCVWVAARRYRDDLDLGNQLLHYDARGARSLVVDLADRMPLRISVDSLDGGVWVANLNRSVEKYSIGGTQDVTVPMKALAVQVGPDGKGVWAFTAEESLKLSATGEIQTRVPHARKSSLVWVAAAAEKSRPREPMPRP